MLTVIDDNVLFWLVEKARKGELVMVQGAPAPRRKPGRPNSTALIARITNQLLTAGRNMTEILKILEDRFPGDDRVRNVRQIMRTWDRHYGALRPKK